MTTYKVWKYVFGTNTRNNPLICKIHILSKQNMQFYIFFFPASSFDQTCAFKYLHQAIHKHAKYLPGISNTKVHAVYHLFSTKVTVLFRQQLLTHMQICCCRWEVHKGMDTMKSRITVSLFPFFLILNEHTGRSIEINCSSLLLSDDATLCSKFHINFVFNPP